jgi:hypothetical protein
VPEDRTCQRCRGPVDRTEQLCAVDDKLLWLHPLCQDNYLEGPPWRRAHRRTGRFAERAVGRHTRRSSPIRTPAARHCSSTG